MAKFTEDDFTMGELDETELEELGRLVKEGYTSGRLDSENRSIYFELRYNIWGDDKAKVEEGRYECR